MKLTKAELAKLIDHTNVRPDATTADILRLCQEAREYGFGTVCVPSSYTAKAAAEIRNTGIKLCTVIGFPHGDASLQSKVAEARQAALDGTDEIDIVLNIGALKEGDTTYVMSEADKVIEGARDVRNDIYVKLILETGYLTEAEKLAACWVATGAGADAIKTSTGYGPTGANKEDVAFLRKVVGQALSVKASGGIRTLADALAMLEAGADRLGTSSGPAIMREWPQDQP